MKLARFVKGDGIRVGVIDGAEVVDVSGLTDGTTNLISAIDTLTTADLQGQPRYDLGETKLLPPVARPPKFFGIGMNYAAHLSEVGGSRPEFPQFFNKQPTCVVGPGDPIVIPQHSTTVDFEGELGVVIGRECRNVAVDEAYSVIAGYLIVNDVSERDWQFRSPTWTLGKSYDTHGPIGPFLVSADEIRDPHDLELKTFVNGELMQQANTGEMLYDIPSQIAALSQACTLEAGDVIATGTPAGVGYGRQPPRYLKAGDSVRITIESIGVLENPVMDEVDGDDDETRSNASAERNQ
jgi:2-keto-4-pentenoate hydratase/2-oxohepta-3-ene-1,7-dioic acid hydratase in catechol pathway